MHIDWWTIALQTVNFAVLAWLLHRYLYKPVLAMIDKRKSQLQLQADEARGVADQAKAQLVAVAAERAGLVAEREQMLKAAAIQGQAAAELTRAQGRKEAQALLDDARNKIAMERDHALAEAQRLALDLGADFARRLLAEMPQQLRAEAWIGRIEQHLQGLSKAALAELRRQLTDRGTLVVVTAAALTPETAELWRSRLRAALDAGISPRFEVNPELIAGAELHFPTTILGFSWLSALAALRKEGLSHEHAH